MGGGTHVGLIEFSQRGIYTLYSGASVMKYVPFVRRLFSITGFTDVSKRGLRRVLDTKTFGPQHPYNVVHLVVGGIHEMFYTTHDEFHEQIILRKRKGFVKLALQTQSDLIPMYTFGANQTYMRLFHRNSVFCRLSSVLQVSLVTWLGRWNIPMGFVPNKIPLLGVIGPVFEVPKVDTVTDELIQQTHEQFCEKLKELFDTYKVVYVNQMGADESWLLKELSFEDE